MKTKVVAILVVLATVGFYHGSVFAHVLATDGDIGAVLHINPDDNPVSGTPTNYILSFDDTTNRLRLADCNCNVVFKIADQTVATKPLTVSDETDSSDTFTFPEPAVYTMVVSGTPKKPGAFQAFHITYTIRVIGGNLTQMQPFPPLLGVGMALFIGLILLVVYSSELTDNKGNKE